MNMRGQEGRKGGRFVEGGSMNLREGREDFVVGRVEEGEPEPLKHLGDRHAVRRGTHVGKGDVRGVRQRAQVNRIWAEIGCGGKDWRCGRDWRSGWDRIPLRDLHAELQSCSG